MGCSVFQYTKTDLESLKELRLVFVCMLMNTATDRITPQTSSFFSYFFNITFELYKC